MPNSINRIKLFFNRCVGCGICVELCPHSAIPSSLIGFISSIAEIDETKCNGCGKCVQVCSHGAIILPKK
ncbi:MAG: 4Fe-4S binding protein [Candidatus Thorarchaeota archaeon]